MDLFKNVPPEKNFILSDGTVLKNIKQLISVLKKMSDDAFSHHVGQDYNHFANWIHDVYDNPSLAAKISSTTDKSLIINYLSSSLNPPKVVKKPVKVEKVLVKVTEKKLTKKVIKKKPLKKVLKKPIKKIKSHKKTHTKKKSSKKSDKVLVSKIKDELNELQNFHVNIDDIAEGFFKTMWNDFKNFFSKDTISIVVEDVKKLVPKKN